MSRQRVLHVQDSLCDHHIRYWTITKSSVLLLASVVPMLVIRSDNVFSNVAFGGAGFVAASFTSVTTADSTTFVFKPTATHSIFGRSRLAAFNNKITIGQQPNYRRHSNLSMHMGHSHSHHHSHNDQTNTNRSAVSTVSNGEGNKLSIQLRRCAIILFCAFVTLGRPIVTKGLGSLRFTDYAMFSIAAIGTRYLIEPLRREVKHAIKRLQTMGDGIAKHAPPLSDTMFSMTRMLLRPSLSENDTLASSTNSASSGSVSSSSSSLRYNNEAADRVTILGGLMNVVLSAGKFFIGLSCHSSALIADAGHSLSDLFSDFITLWAVQVGRLPPDDDHPYGHGKFEAIGALFLALTLLGTGISVGAMSYKKLMEILVIHRAVGSLAATAPMLPKFPALVMAGVSIISKEWLFRITRTVGERINSQVVIANAWHHRSDAYSSVLALFSIGLAMVGIVAADAAAGLLVAGMICMTGAEVLGESIKQLTDTTDERLVQTVTNIAANFPSVEAVNRVRARQVGSSSVIDLTVCIPESMSSVRELRTVENRLRTRILQEDGVLDVDVRATTASAIPVGPSIDSIHEHHHDHDHHHEHSHDHNPQQQYQLQHQDVSSTEKIMTSDGLLMATTKSQLASASGITTPIISKLDVESCVRAEIKEHHPEVQNVLGIRVHYQDILTKPINVDVDISLHDYVVETTTIADASHLAEHVRETLERTHQINQASIYLDLNSNRDLKYQKN